MRTQSNPYFDETIETLSADAIAAMQLEKLSGQLTYGQQHAPFIASKLRQVGAAPQDIKTFDDLAKLPFTEKSELRDTQTTHPPLGSHLAAPMRDVVRVHASSGTTGTPSYIGLTRYDTQRWTECIARSYWAQGLRPDSVFAMGLSIGFFVGGLPVASAVEAIGATLLPIGTGASDRLIASIQAMKANTLATTPSYALYLAETARRQMNIDPGSLGIQNVMVGAEPGGGIPAVRAQIEREWNARCTESIGNADVITIHSAECEAQAGCHFMVPDYLLMELINPDTGEILPANEPHQEGEMVFTHLDRQANPMLRFRTRDRVIVDNTSCACGRTGPRLRCIGRTDDMLIVRGVNVWPSAIKDVVMSFLPEVSGHLLISLDVPGPAVTPPLTIRVEAARTNLTEKQTSELARRIEQRLRDKLIFSSAITVVPPASLPRTEMKARLIEHNYQ